MIPAEKPAPSNPAAICIVDGKAQERNKLERLLSRIGPRVRVFASAEELIDALPGLRPCLLVTAMDLPGVDGLGLMGLLRERGEAAPVILISDHSDIPTAVSAMRSGAIDFFERPVVERVLLKRAEAALKAGHQA